LPPGRYGIGVNEPADARWVSDRAADTVGSVVGGAGVATLSVALLASVAALTETTATDPERIGVALSAVPPTPVDGPAIAPRDRLPAIAVGSARIATWVGLLCVAWWTTGRSADEWATTEYRIAGPRRAIHRLVANWIGRGIGRLRYRASERAYLSAVLRHGLAVGVGYAVVVGVVLWWVQDPAVVMGAPVLGTLSTAAFAACVGLAGGVLRGCSGS